MSEEMNGIFEAAAEQMKEETPAFAAQAAAAVEQPKIELELTPAAPSADQILGGVQAAAAATYAEVAQGSPQAAQTA